MMEQKIHVIKPAICISQSLPHLLLMMITDASVTLAEKYQPNEDQISVVLHSCVIT